MLLFFFMTATTMKDSDLMVENRLPAADQITKLEKKDRIMYIYAGKPSSQYKQFGEEPRIQFNDAFISVEDVQASVLQAQADMNEELKTECMELCVTACEKFSQNNEVCFRNYIIFFFKKKKKKKKLID